MYFLHLKVVEIDFMDCMLKKTTSADEEHGFKNVEFRKVDIENSILVENDSMIL